eukprot:743693_1
MRTSELEASLDLEDDMGSTEEVVQDPGKGTDVPEEDEDQESLNFFGKHWKELLDSHKTDRKDLVQEAWNLYDKDNSGTIDRDELRMLCLDFYCAMPEIQKRLSNPMW